MRVVDYRVLLGYQSPCPGPGPGCVMAVIAIPAACKGQLERYWL